MSNSFGELDTRLLAPRKHLLLNDLDYDDSIFGRIVAKRGFVTNYATIDKLRNLFLILLYILLAGWGDKASTIHDFLYGRYPITRYPINRQDGSQYWPTRKECDEIFYRALLAEGVDKCRSMIFYIGVRLFGSSSFKSTKRVWNE